MGLGKTLQSLMLVHYNPPPPGWALSVAGIRAQAEEAARKAAQEREERYGIPRLASEAPDPVPVRTTLVVVPANLLSQWMDEIELHLLPGAIKWVFINHRICALWTFLGFTLDVIWVFFEAYSQALLQLCCLLLPFTQCVTPCSSTGPMPACPAPTSAHMLLPLPAGCASTTKTPPPSSTFLSLR